MSYIGNTATQQAFTPAVDFFNGNGSTTAFTLSRPVASVAQVQAVISNVPQKPGDAYTVSGNTITFTSAPPSGTQNIYVYYTSPITQVIAPGQNTVSPASLSTGAPAWDASGNMALNGATPSATGSGFNSFQVRAANITSDGTASIFYNNAYYDGSVERYVATGAAQKLVLNNAANGSYVLNVAPSGTAGAVITWTNVLQVNKDATVALQGGTSSSGTGIAFPATQLASSNANTLDDYEEGTFTPTASSAGYTISAATGFYTKIGRVVNLTWNLTFSAVPAANSSIQLNGAPFASGTVVANTCTSGVCRENSITGAIYVTNIQNNGQTLLELNSMDGVGAGQQRTLRVNEVYSCSLTYFTS